jgi:hypothetical protein
MMASKNWKDNKMFVLGKGKYYAKVSMSDKSKQLFFSQIFLKLYCCAGWESL